MRDICFKKLLLLPLVFLLMLSAAEAQQNKRYVKNPEKELFGKSLNKKNVKVKESPAVVRAKKKQAKAAKKADRDYEKYVSRNRSHALEIQSPEVRARMKENRKESDNKYLAKKKKTSRASKKTARKYRK